MCNKYLILFDEPSMGGAYKMGPKPRTVQEDTACTGFSQSDTIYCTGCAQNCILLHSQRGRGDRYCRWCTHWGPTSLIVDCKTLRCIRCKRFKCKRRQCMELKHITCDSAGDVWGVCVTDRGGWFLWQGAFALGHPRSQDSAPLLIRP